MANPNLQKIIKLTQTQYNILYNGGTVGDYTGLNDNYLYLIQEDYDFPTTNVARKILMSTSTAGLVEWQSLQASDIPNLAASKITSGTFDTARIPSLAASKITSGTFDAARIPSLDASKITSGTFADARIASASTWNAKYTKPSGGIPASDLAESYSLSTHTHDTRYVRFDAAQSLTNDQKSQARTNIGAGTSSFSGNYNDLTNKPTIPATNVIPATTTANKVLLSTTTSGTAAWSAWTTAGFLKTNGSGVISIDTNNYAGSSSAGGAATSANKLNTNAGSATNPVYFSGGVPVACTYSLNKTVPADAVFTDTTYSAEKGISLSGTKFGHSNTAITAQTTQALYPIKIDAYGHITGYGTAVTSLPASDVYAWAKAATKPSYSFSEITSRGESWLDWGGRKVALTPIGACLSEEHSANRLAYINGDLITVEYSRDGGTTWTDQGLSASTKSQLCTLSTSITIGNPASGTACVANQSKTRITITAQNGSDPSGRVYTDPRKMLILMSTAKNVSLLVEYRTGTNYENNGPWTTFDTYTVSGWSGWNDIPLILGTLGGGSTQKSNNWQLRLTFTVTEVNSSYPTAYQISALRIYGANSWATPSTLAARGHMYTYDMSKNVVFPAGVSATSFTENGTTLSNKYVAKSLTSAKGDMIYASAANTPARLAIGSNGQFLRTNSSGIPAWTTIAKADVNTWINLLDTGSSTPVDADYYISQYVGGGTTTTTYHRRPMSALYSYVKGKLDSVYLGISATAADSSKLNGQAASYYLNYNNLSNKPSLTTTIGSYSGQGGTELSFGNRYFIQVDSGTSAVFKLPSLPTIPATNVIPATTTANKVLLSTTTSGTAAWSSWNTAGFLKTNNTGVVSIDNNTYSLSSHDHDSTYLKLSGGTLTGRLYWNNSTALPRANYGSEAALEYIIGIRAFSDGGGTLYEKKSDFLSGYLMYDAQTLTDAQKTQARTNIGAGTSSFTGYTSSNKLSTNYIQNDAGWTSNTGTVTQVKVGTTAYNPSSGVVSLPAYPTKASWNYDDTYLKLSGGTLTGALSITCSNVAVPLEIKSTGTTDSYVKIWNKDNSHSAYLAANTSSLLTMYENSQWRTLATRTWVEGKGYTTNTGTITQIKVNGTSIATSGAADIPAANSTTDGVVTTDDQHFSGLKIFDTGIAFGDEDNYVFLGKLPQEGSYVAKTLLVAMGDSNGETEYWLESTDDYTVHYIATQDWVTSQGYTSNTGTITGVSINNTSIATSGVANIPVASNLQLGVVKIVNTRSSTISASSGGTTGKDFWVELSNSNHAFVNVNSATASSYGLVKAAAVRSSAITATTGGTTSDRYYGVELDSNGKMFVNVPWSGGSGSAYYSNQYNDDYWVASRASLSVHTIGDAVNVDSYGLTLADISPSNSNNAVMSIGFAYNWYHWYNNNPVYRRIYTNSKDIVLDVCADSINGAGYYGGGSLHILPGYQGMAYGGNYYDSVEISAKLYHPGSQPQASNYFSALGFAAAEMKLYINDATSTSKVAQLGVREHCIHVYSGTTHACFNIRGNGPSPIVFSTYANICSALYNAGYKSANQFLRASGIYGSYSKPVVGVYATSSTSGFGIVYFNGTTYSNIAVTSLTVNDTLADAIIP